MIENDFCECWTSDPLEDSSIHEILVKRVFQTLEPPDELPFEKRGDSESPPPLPLVVVLPLRRSHRKCHKESREETHKESRKEIRKKRDNLFQSAEESILVESTAA